MRPRGSRQLLQYLDFQLNVILAPLNVWALNSQFHHWHLNINHSIPHLTIQLSDSSTDIWISNFQKTFKSAHTGEARPSLSRPLLGACPHDVHCFAMLSTDLLQCKVYDRGPKTIKNSCFDTKINTVRYMTLFSNCWFASSGAKLGVNGLRKSLW